MRSSVYFMALLICSSLLACSQPDSPSQSDAAPSPPPMEAVSNDTPPSDLFEPADETPVSVLTTPARLEIIESLYLTSKYLLFNGIPFLHGKPKTLDELLDSGSSKAACRINLSETGAERLRILKHVQVQQGRSLIVTQILPHSENPKLVDLLINDPDGFIESISVRKGSTHEGLVTGCFGDRIRLLVAPN